MLVYEVSSAATDVDLLSSSDRTYLLERDERYGGCVPLAVRHKYQLGCSAVVVHISHDTVHKTHHIHVLNPGRLRQAVCKELEEREDVRHQGTSHDRGI